MRDYSGQLWAYEKSPIREDGYWRVANEFLPPTRPKGLHYLIDESTHKVVCNDPKPEQEYHHSYTQHWGNLYRQRDRRICVPLNDCPFNISWKDEPFDLVAMGIVPEADMKKWSDALTRATV